MEPRPQPEVMALLPKSSSPRTLSSFSQTSNSSSSSERENDSMSSRDLTTPSEKRNPTPNASRSRGLQSMVTNCLSLRVMVRACSLIIRSSCVFRPSLSIRTMVLLSICSIVFCTSGASSDLSDKQQYGVLNSTFQEIVPLIEHFLYF